MEPDETSSADSMDAQIDALAESFIARWRRGENPSVSEFAERAPAVARRIRELFPSLRFVEEARRASLANQETGSTADGESLQDRKPLERLGEYRIVREIGRGGMGVVYEAMQESLGRRVALKVLPFHHLLDQKRLERFRREARAAAALQHPHIVPVHGIGEEGGLHYYAMQFVPGHGLDRILSELKRLQKEGTGEREGSDSSLTSTARLLLESPGGLPAGGRLPYFHNVARLGAEVAEALSYAHGQGILHRDIKPSNLLLDDQGAVWIADFGLAKLAESDDLTDSGELVGTFRYMAPERFRGASEPSSDVYSLGMTLYELLTLTPAFDDTDRGRLMERILKEEPVRPKKIDRRIPRDLELVILKAMAKEPAWRYPAAELAGDLRRFLEGEVVRVRRPSTLERAWRWCRRNRAAALAAALLVFLLALAAGFGGGLFTPRGGRTESALTAPPREIKPEESTAGGGSSPAFGFAPAANFSAGPEAANLFDLAAGDLDGDGAPDLAAADLDSDNLTVFKNDGAGAFTVLATIPAGKKPRAIAIADLNQDGRNDLIAANWRSSDLSVLFNQGSGVFTEVRQGLGFYPFALAVADFDGDGPADLAVIGGAASLCILRNGGDGSLSAAANLSVPRFPNSLVAADLDGDRDADLAAGCVNPGQPGKICLFFNQGRGEFEAADPIGAPFLPLSLKAADLDGDRDLDLALADNEVNVFATLVNRGKGAFKSGMAFALGMHPHGLAAADFDGDGDLDLATSSEALGAVAVVLNKGDGTFPELLNLPIGGGPNGAVAADLNGDGSPDLAAANGFSNNIGVILSQKRAPEAMGRKNK